MSKVKVNLNFNPSLSGSVEAVITTHSEKVENYFMSDTEMMKLSSKPNIKSIKVIGKYVANSPENIDVYNSYKNG